MQKPQLSEADRGGLPYTYQPLITRGNGRPTFRFLDLLSAKSDTDPLRCRIIHASLGEIQYYALSYTWGEPIFNRSLVVLEGWGDGNQEEFQISITANLDVALRRMRIDYAGKMLLWADAVCINQADTAERTEQVQQMGDLFSLAQRVLIWTGLDNRMKEGFKCLEFLSQRHNSEADHGPGGWLPIRVHSAPHFQYINDSEDISNFESPAHKTTEKLENTQIGTLLESQGQDEHTRFVRYEDSTSKRALLSGVEKHEYNLLTKFFTRPYFQRRWIIQEVALAKEVSLYCGNAVIADKVRPAILTLRSLPTYEWHGSDKAAAFIAMLSNYRQNSLDSPLSVLHAYPNFLCRDARDHVFAMLGVLKSKLTEGLKFPKHGLMTASYESSIEDVYKALAEYQLAYQVNSAGISELLATAGAMRANTRDESISPAFLPSWVPDWRYSPRFVPCSPLSAYSISENPWPGNLEPCPTIVTQSGVLQTCGGKINTVVECVKCNILDPDERESLRSRLGGWFALESYRQFYNSALEVISEAIVEYCYKNFPSEYTSFWLFGNKKKIFDAMDRMEEKDNVEFQDFLKIIPTIMQGRSFILSGSGHIGISCEDSEPGDSIIMMKDKYMTFVMRNFSRQDMPEINFPTPENLMGTFKLIGDIYIHRPYNFPTRQKPALQSLLIR
ncbi:hypothetical protein EG329_001751 [Mollisiaceae sp. DMI_Dod_QoI]|nr:hypothetical protein EG329_001751 [Helotiales sp. DMI_Dod_QoI]